MDQKLTILTMNDQGIPIPTAHEATEHDTTKNDEPEEKKSKVSENEETIPDEVEQSSLHNSNNSTYTFFCDKILTNYVVTKIIFDRLENVDILNCGLVSKAFKKFSRIYLHRAHYRQFPLVLDDLSRQDELLEILSNTGTALPYNGVIFNYMTFQLYLCTTNNADEAAKTRYLLQRIYKKLPIRHVHTTWDFVGDFTTFRNCFKWCKFRRLETLSINGMKFYIEKLLEFLKKQEFRRLKTISFERSFPESPPRPVEGDTNLLQLLRASPRLRNWPMLVSHYEVEDFAKAKKIPLITALRLTYIVTETELQFIQSTNLVLRHLHIREIYIRDPWSGIGKNIIELIVGTKDSLETIQTSSAFFVSMFRSNLPPLEKVHLVQISEGWDDKSKINKMRESTRAMDIFPNAHIDYLTHKS